jgi:NAD(P)-dependent dehydrogenase (short-subunit alcohol dehydrogenase family)
MDLGLQGRAALVVGPEDDIAEACRRVLAAEGARIAASVGDEAIDIVVAHATVRHGSAVMAIESADEWLDAWDEVVAALDVFGRALPGMRERGWGRLVWVGTAGSRSLDADPAGQLDEVGAVTSLAMRAAQKVIAAEGGPEGVIANSVLGGGSAAPDDVAAAVAFYCSQWCGYTTGVSIDVSGGIGSGVF